MSGSKKKTSKKKTSKSRLIFAIGFIVGAIMLIVALVNIIKIGHEYRKNRAVYDDANDRYVTVSFATKGNNDGKEASKEEMWYDYVDVDIQGISQENSDVVGWIWFEDGSISYPVLHSSDNNTYLRTTYKKKSATAGSIFVEAGNSGDFSDYHTIIYGHNMRDNSMFGKLKEYKNKSHYEGHEYFQIITKDKKYRYKIFAYSDVDTESYVYTIPYGPYDEYQEFIDRVIKDSMIKTDVEVTKDDRTITLSTCSNDDKRFVVHAVLIEER